MSDTIKQAIIFDWVKRCFGPAHARSLHVRGLRLAEEAIEAAQACDVDVALIHKLVDHVYSKPKGEIAQEIGGVALTMIALAEAAGLSANACEEGELLRVLDKPPAFFTERNAKKDALGFGLKKNV